MDLDEQILQRNSKWLERIERRLRIVEAVIESNELRPLPSVLQQHLGAYYGSARARLALAGKIGHSETDVIKFIHKRGEDEKTEKEEWDGTGDIEPMDPADAPPRTYLASEHRPVVPIVKRWFVLYKDKGVQIYAGDAWNAYGHATELEAWEFAKELQSDESVWKEEAVAFVIVPVDVPITLTMKNTRDEDE